MPALIASLRASAYRRAALRASARRRSQTPLPHLSPYRLCCALAAATPLRRAYRLPDASFAAAGCTRVLALIASQTRVLQRRRTGGETRRGETRRREQARRAEAEARREGGDEHGRRDAERRGEERRGGEEEGRGEERRGEERIGPSDMRSLPRDPCQRRRLRQASRGRLVGSSLARVVTLALASNGRFRVPVQAPCRPGGCPSVQAPCSHVCGRVPWRARAAGRLRYLSSGLMPGVTPHRVIPHRAPSEGEERGRVPLERARVRGRAARRRLGDAARGDARYPNPRACCRRRRYLPRGDV